MLKKLSYWVGIAIVGTVVGMSLQFAKAWTEPASAPPAGNVGAPITTGSTEQTRSGKLNISGALSLGTDKWHTSTDGKFRLYFGDANGATGGRTYFGSQNGYVFRSANDAVDVITVTNSGSVGIGASPAAKLHIQGTTYGPLFLNGPNEDIFLRPGIAAGRTYMDVGTGMSIGTYAATHMLDVGGSASFSGNVGIGTATPATRLHVGDGGDGYANGLTIRSSYPTIYFRDTNERSAMIHVNGNNMYFLRGGSIDGSGNDWGAYNGAWPLTLNLENNAASFGGSITATGSIGGSILYAGWGIPVYRCPSVGSDCGGASECNGQVSFNDASCRTNDWGYGSDGNQCGWHTRTCGAVGYVPFATQ